MALEEAIKITVDTNAEKAAEELDRLNKELRETAAQYLKLNEAEKKTPFGKQLAAQMETLQAQIKGVTGEEKLLNKEIEKSTEKTRDLQAELGEFEKKLALLDKGTPEFIAMAKQAGALKDRIDEAKKAIDIFASDTRQLEGVIGSLSLITSGFGAIQGAMALAGGQSEELDKVLTQVNATMLVLNSLQQIQINLQKDSAARIFITTTAQKLYNAVVKASTLSTKAFNTALAATGVGLALLALTYLPQILELFKRQAKELDYATSLQKSYNDTLTQTTEKMVAERAQIEANLSVAKDKNLSDEKRNQALQKAIQAQPEYLKGLTLENLETKKGVQIVDEYRKSFEKLIRAKAAEAELIKIETQLLELERARLDPAKAKAQNKELAKAEAEKLQKLGASNDLIAKQSKAITDSFVITEALIENQTKKEKTLLEQRNFLLSQIELGDERVASAKTKEDVRSIFQELTFETKEYTGFFNQEWNDLIDNINIQGAQAAPKVLSDALRESREATLKEQTKFWDNWSKNANEAAETERDIFNARQEIYSQTASLFSGLTTIVAVEGKGMTDIQKTFALVQIGIDTARALSSAMAATYATTPEPIAASIKYLTVAANIIATAGKIKQVLSSGHHSDIQPSSNGDGSAPSRTPFSDSTIAPATNVNVSVNISERDLRKANLISEQRRRGATVVV